MKILRTPIIIFSVLFVLQLISCTKHSTPETLENTAIDSVHFYMKKMEASILTDSVYIGYCNKALQFSKKPTTTKVLLIYKLNSFSNLNQLDSVIYISKQLVHLDQQEKDSVSLGDHSFKLAYYFNMHHQKDSAFVYFKKAKNIYLQLKDSAHVGESLAMMAIIQSDFGDYYGSDANAILALKYLDKNNIPYLTSVYNCIAISSRKQQDYTEAIYWYDKAIAISTNEKYKAFYINNKANAHRDLKQYTTAIALLTSLKNDTLLKINLGLKSKVIDNLAYTMWLQNNKAAVLKDLLIAMNLRLKQEDLYGLIASYSHLSTYYAKQNKATSLMYAHKMYQKATEVKSPQDQLEALQKLVEFSENASTKRYYSNYLKISDSIQVAEKKVLNKFVKLKFDTEKNREENLQLKIKTAQKELEIHKSNTRNVALLSSGTLIFIGLLAFIYFRKQKYQLEKRAEVYKTEKRIAKKIHDEVANNVVNIMNKVQYTETNNDVLLDDLEKVYLLTRNISHENNAVVTGAKFEAFLKNMLRSFNSATTLVILKDLQQVDIGTLASEKQIEIYRVLQECMVNMRKHSQATLVAITFQKTGTEYAINYSDNGVGLDVASLTLKNGLQNVETRIQSIKGTIIFETSLNNGFKAFIRFKN